MDGKMKDWLSQESMMRSSFGFGLGLLVASILSGLNTMWIGIAIMVVVVGLEMMRKKK